MSHGMSLAASLAHEPGGRLFGVFWGSLVVADLTAVSHLPSAVGVGGVVLVVAAGSRRQSTPTSLAAAGMGWLFVNGFLVNRLGQLGWDGLPDFWRLVLLAAVAWAAARAGNPDGFLTRGHGLSQAARAPSRDATGRPSPTVERERHAVGR